MHSEKNPFRVYIDSLKHGGEDKIFEKIDPAFLELAGEGDIRSSDPVLVDGTAYLAGDFLILSLHIAAKLELKCALCNEFFSLAVDLPHFTHEEPLEEIKHGFFDFGELVRETIFLEVPFYPQCSGKVCANRKRVEKYLKTEDTGEAAGYKPFQNIDI